MTDWLFLNYNNPDEARSGQTRKKIRAHVTSRQHALTRQNLDEDNDYKQSKQSGQDDRPLRSSGVSSSSSRPSLPKKKSALASRTKRRLKSERFIPSQHISCWNPQEDDSTSDSSPARHETTYEEALKVAAFPSPNSINLNVAPVPKKEWYDWLHDYWFNGTLPKAKGRLKVNEDQMERYMMWTRQLQNTEPAMYYMSLLLATGIPVANGQFPLLKALWLRGRAVSALNEALADPERATSDAMIQAVGFVALHEHIYGDRSATHQHHRPAQQRMINMRGGIDKLNLPPEVKQIMVWYDRLMAAEAGNEPYFTSLADGQNIKLYSNAEAMAITNNASPARYKHPGYGTETEVELAH